MATLVADEARPDPLEHDPPASERDGFPPMPRAWRVASLIGGALALSLFAYVLFVGKTELTAAPSGNFYDLQTRAWFDGQWDIPEVPLPRTELDVPEPPYCCPEDKATYSPLSIEAIVIDGREYLYYGPVPSVLRAPVLASTDALDGELTQPFMLAAFALALVALTRLHWRIRCLVRGGDTLGEREPLLAGATLFALGAGSVLLYLGSQPTVYHEATLWGVAFALWAYAAVLDVHTTSAVRKVVAAGAWTMLAVLSRASVGIGPLVALALLLAFFAWRALQERRRGDRSGSSAGDRSGRVAVALLCACVVAVAAYAAVNMVKFGEPFRLPLEKQVFSGIDANRIQALEDNSGSLFGLKFVPSTVVQYARPDAIEVDRLAPWLNFPREQATVVGDVLFDTRDEASSVPSSMPLWTVLSIVGAVALVRDLVRRERRLGPLIIPVVGAAAGCVGVLTIAFIANRYLGDLLPFVALLGLAGVQVFAVRWRTFSRPTRVVTAGALGLLCLWSVVANLALAVEYQRLIAPVDESTRSAFVQWQYTLPRAPGTLARVPGWELSPTGERGDLRVVCASGMDLQNSGLPCEVWWSDGFEWRSIAQGSYDDIEDWFDSKLTPERT